MIDAVKLRQQLHKISSMDFRLKNLQIFMKR